MGNLQERNTMTSIFSNNPFFQRETEQAQYSFGQIAPSNSSGNIDSCFDKNN